MNTMNLRELFEARRNPGTTVKTSIIDHLKAEIANAKGSIAGMKNRFVSFTAIEKLGLNKKSIELFNTMICVYSYTIEYIYKVLSSGNKDQMFATDRPYVNVFSVNGNVVNIDTISDVSAYIPKLSQVMAKYGVNGDKYAQMQEDAKQTADHKTTGGIFWKLTMDCATIISKSSGKPTPNVWAHMLRQIGIDGVVDPGKGIIHPNEPTQLVMFSMQNINNVTRYQNKQYAGQDARKDAHPASYDINALTQLANSGNSIAIVDALAKSPSKFMAKMFDINPSLLQDREVVTMFIKKGMGRLLQNPKYITQIPLSLFKFMPDALYSRINAMTDPKAISRVLMLDFIDKEHVKAVLKKAPQLAAYLPERFKHDPELAGMAKQ